MAEVYWIDGFHFPVQHAEEVLQKLAIWLEEKHIRPTWIEQIHLLSGQEVSWNALLVDTPFSASQCGFLYPALHMDEHFLLQSLIRRMRMDECESQCLLYSNAGTLSGALLMTHRQVGRYNLRPRLLLAEQMSALSPEALMQHLPDLAERTEGLYICGNQAQVLQNLSNQAGELSSSVFPDVPLIGCLQQIQADKPLRERPGLLISQQPDQPVLVTSIQGI